MNVIIPFSKFWNSFHFIDSSSPPKISFPPFHFLSPNVTSYPNCKNILPLWDPEFLVESMSRGKIPALDESLTHVRWFLHMKGSNGWRKEMDEEGSTQRMERRKLMKGALTFFLQISTLLLIFMLFIPPSLSETRYFIPISSVIIDLMLFCIPDSLLWILHSWVVCNRNFGSQHNFSIFTLFSLESTRSISLLLWITHSISFNFFDFLLKLFKSGSWFQINSRYSV